MEAKKKIILILALFPFLVYSQVRINGSSEIRVQEDGAIRVTGNTEVASGAYLSILGNYKTSANLINNGNASNIIIESTESQTGSLIVKGSATGELRVERYLSPSTWHFLATSVVGATSGDFYFNGNPEVYASYWDEPNSAWPYIIGTSESMPLGVGYKMWVADAKSPVTAEMEGSLRTSDLSVNLSTTGTGWNLIGNPFTSEINTNEGNWGTNTSGSFYVWDSTYNNGDYRVWNGSAGDLTDGVIPISQSFFVYAESAGSYTIPKAAQTHGTDDFYKSKSESSFVRFQLDVKGFGNTLFIGFPDNGSENIDYKGDTYKIYSKPDSPQLYGIQEGEKLCILADSPLSDETRVIPVYIDQWVNGEYTLAISDYGGVNEYDIYLEDKSSKNMIHLSQTKVYQFYGSENDSQDRFNLHFSKKVSAVPHLSSEEDLVHIYSTGGMIYFQAQEGQEIQDALIQIYNINGQLLYEKSSKISDQLIIATDLCPAYYFIHMSFDGKSVLKKVMIN